MHKLLSVGTLGKSQVEHLKKKKKDVFGDMYPLTHDDDDDDDNEGDIILLLLAQAISIISYIYRDGVGTRS